MRYSINVVRCVVKKGPLSITPFLHKYIYVYAYIICIYSYNIYRFKLLLPSSLIDLYTYMYRYICTHIYTHIYICIHTYIYAYVDIHIRKWLGDSVHVRSRLQCDDDDRFYYFQQ